MSRLFRPRTLALAAALALAVPAVATLSLSADAGPRHGGWGDRGPMGEFFESDGRFDRDAFAERMQAHYDAMREAGNGTVTRDIFVERSLEAMRPHMEERAARMFDRIDRNEDGVLSEAEFTAAKERMAERMEHRPPRPRDGGRDHRGERGGRSAD